MCFRSLYVETYHSKIRDKYTKKYVNIFFFSYIFNWKQDLFLKIFVRCDILNSTLKMFFKSSGMYLLSRKILIWIVNIKSQEKKVVKIFKFDAKKVKEILNLSIQFFIKSFQGLLLNNSTFSRKYIVKKNDILLAPGCFDLRIKEQNQTK